MAKRKATAKKTAAKPKDGQLRCMFDGCDRYVREQFSCTCLGAQTVRAWRDSCVADAVKMTEDRMRRERYAILDKAYQQGRQAGLGEANAELADRSETEVLDTEGKGLFTLVCSAVLLVGMLAGIASTLLVQLVF